ncbi:hypothetical protein GCM10011344_32940 [Dokdonia pacifica]|uniref:Tellurite resistance protein TerB n=1 Tax=Dokdonia pacifica TaxID=1627892 RepID=A0A239BJB9_9FLAO|nr:hypothetical protein [Dokdonia pacifica]GGG29477.1 hypothetical protein GCM10011344_32940 [Dokdonia pacifica]SNS07173.1 hypothetical protein SAMN06265376_106168 [Dokdonia pacifica]
MPVRTKTLLYQNLGKLFYAIAASDTIIQDQEFEALQQCVQKYWKDYNDLNQVFEEEYTQVIEAVFEGVEAFELSAEEMFQDFISYKREHPQLFTNVLNTLIMATAKTIAYAFENVNTSEQKFLTQLENELSIIS